MGKSEFEKAIDENIDQNRAEQQYPEHDKLQNVREESQFVGTFLEWAQNKGYFLATRVEDEDLDGRDFVTIKVHKTTEQLLAEFHDIDLGKLEDEKRQMLARIRELHQEPKAPGQS